MLWTFWGKGIANGYGYVVTVVDEFVATDG